MTWERDALDIANVRASRVTKQTRGASGGENVGRESSGPHTLTALPNAFARVAMSVSSNTEPP